MGFFSRLLSSRSPRTSKRALDAGERELAGDLGRAVQLYDEAGLPDDVARVLLLRADAESSAEKRIAYCALAAQKALDEPLKRRALGRKALLAFDVLKARGASAMASEVLAVAKELEAAGELERAADAYALAGDQESEVRALTAAGAIDRLEERLRVTDATDRALRDLELLLRKLEDLDRTAERRAALGLARASLARRDDQRVADVERRIRARLVRGPIVDLQIDGKITRAALGDDVTIGRGDATIVVASRAVSRRHVRVFRGAGGPHVEDLGTRNGTFLAGARIGSSIPVGEGLAVELGNEVRCVLSRAGEGVRVEIAGGVYEAPLGPYAVGDWRITRELDGPDAYVVLANAPGGERPYLGEYQLAPRIELAAGDALAKSRAGVVALRVLADVADDETHS